jgi:hypothetical protein
MKKVKVRGVETGFSVVYAIRDCSALGWSWDMGGVRMRPSLRLKTVTREGRMPPRTGRGSRTRAVA